MTQKPRLTPDFSPLRPQPWAVSTGRTRTPALSLLFPDPHLWKRWKTPAAGLCLGKAGG